MDDRLDLIAFEFVFWFDFLVETAAAQEFEYDVKGVVGLENFIESHVIGVA